MARSFRACNSGWRDKFFSLPVQHMVEVKLATVLLGVTFAAGEGRRFWFRILFARRYGFSSSLGLYLSRCGIEALLFVLVYWLVQVWFVTKRSSTPGSVVLAGGGGFFL
ncbi:hypothetical protein V8G54_003575 [Vigna mungo]|uniref:Uncharacterized protein n=1 Tax=Vigna mungo TaxID=3915 RepID=A0AAQ3PAA4_VIGMU